MKTVLQRQGEKYVLELDPEIVAEWGIDVGTVLDVNVTGRILTVVPVGMENADAKLEALLKDLAAQYGQSLKKMAQ
jgi:hypothetical protein